MAHGPRRPVDQAGDADADGREPVDRQARGPGQLGERRRRSSAAGPRRRPRWAGGRWPATASVAASTATASVLVPPTSRPATTAVSRRSDSAGRGVEQVDPGRVDRQLDDVAGRQAAAAGRAGRRPGPGGPAPAATTATRPGRRRRVGGERHVHDRLGAERLDEVDRGLDHPLGGYARVGGDVANASGRMPTTTAGPPARRSARVGGHDRVVERQPVGPTERQGARPSASPSSPPRPCREQVHGRRADERGDEQVGGLVVEPLRACRPAGAGRPSSTATRVPIVIASTWSWVT